MSENCHVEPIQKIATPEENRNVEIALLTVWGMGCPNCAARVRNSLVTLNGVVDAYVDHMTGVAKIAFNPKLATVEMLTGAVAGAGNDGHHKYGAQLLTHNIHGSTSAIS